ncbi:MAG: sigma-70 family RNA polymerase sigma factor [Chloroflexota bacterium]|nr:sigma-70 family RNA polymerase sigma factor [Chloroflexota bacterium]
MPPDYAAQSDVELLRAAASNDSDAFMALYDRYNRVAFGLAYRVLGEASAAEEAVQDAFMQVWNRAGTFEDRGDANVRGWLLTIVHHRAIDTRRRSIRHDERSITLDDRLQLRAVGGTWEDVAKRLTTEEMRAALDDLPDDQRRAIEMAYFRGLSQREIAERESMPLGTVKGRMRLGLNKLRTLLTLAETDPAATSER